MQYFVKFLSTAPVLAILWLSVQGAALIEFNRFFPDLPSIKSKRFFVSLTRFWPSMLNIRG